MQCNFNIYIRILVMRFVAGINWEPGELLLLPLHVYAQGIFEPRVQDARAWVYGPAFPVTRECCVPLPRGIDCEYVFACRSVAYSIVYA